MLAEPLRLATEHCRAGRFADALAILRKTAAPAGRPHSYLHRVLLAEALGCTGHRAEALLHATAVLGDRRLDPALQARCHIVVGLIAARDNAQAEATRHFQRAIRLAGRAGDEELTARAQMRLLASLGDAMPPNAVHTLVTDLKRRVARIGDIELLAVLHMELARLEAKRAELALAERHLHEAAALVAGLENPWLKGKLSLQASGVAFLRSELSRSIRHADEAFRYAELSGDSQMRTAALLNAAAAQLVLGQLEEADAKLSRALPLTSDSPYPRIGILLNLAILRILRGELSEAQRFLASAVQLQRNLPSWWSWWTEEVRIWILREQGNWAAIRARAGSALTAATRSFLYAQPSIRLLEAEAALETGDEVAAALALSQPGPPELPLHNLADLERLKGKAFALVGDRGRSAKHLNRAYRMSLAAGDFAAFRRVLNDAGRFHGLRLEEHQTQIRWRPLGEEWTSWRRLGSETTTGLVSGASSGVDATDIALLHRLVALPRAYAFETFHMLAESGCAEFAILALRRPGLTPEVVAARGCSPEEARNHLREAPETDRLSLAEIDGSRLELVARARDLVPARLEFAALCHLIGIASEFYRLRERERRHEALWGEEPDRHAWLGIRVSERMREIWTIARKIADTNLPVLITGETGTGKEVLARAIHQFSQRAAKPFLAFNCRAVPRDLLDSQLFGYRRGAFTGAYEAFPGLIRAAAGGTLFLDEIGDLDRDLQPKLLRFLETGEIHPLGETRPVTADARVIAATNADLEQAVSDGHFREDLFYRLNVVRFHLPPLRERREEIPPLIHHFLRRHGEPVGKGQIRVSDEAMEYLVLYHWPGNVRQLENEVRRFVALAEPDGLVTAENLSPPIRASRRTAPSPDASTTGGPPRIELRLDQHLPVALRQLEVAMIAYALRTAGGRMDRAAELLGISRKGLFLKRRRHGLRATDTAT